LLFAPAALKETVAARSGTAPDSPRERLATASPLELINLSNQKAWLFGAFRAPVSSQNDKSSDKQE